MPPKARPLTRHVFDWNGCRVVYHRGGAGRPVIFLHNGGNDHRIWEYQTAHFSGTCDCIAVDLPGYGDSDRPTVSYSLDYYAGFLGDFIEHLSLDRTLLVGNCVGSAMALRYALTRPGRVDGLVLCNVLTEGTLRPGAFGQLYQFAEHHPRLARLLGLFTGNAMVRRIAREVSPGMQYGATGDPDPRFIDHLRDRYSHPEHLRVLYGLLRNIAGFRDLDRPEKTSGFPATFVLWGEQNKVLPADAGRAWSAVFGPERSVFFPECGHLVMREAHKEVNDEIERFLADSCSEARK